MITFRDIIPASYEVTFIPLAMAYIFFGMGSILSIYIAAIGPVLYGLLCLFFLVADLLDGISIKMLIYKLTFIGLCLFPATVAIVWSFL